MISITTLRNNKKIGKLSLLIGISILVYVVLSILDLINQEIQCYILTKSGFDIEQYYYLPDNVMILQGIGLALSLLTLIAVPTIVIRCFKSRLQFINILILEVLLYTYCVVLICEMWPLTGTTLWFVLSIFNLSLGMVIGNIISVKTVKKNIFTAVLVFVLGIVFAWLPVIVALNS